MVPDDSCPNIEGKASLMRMSTGMRPHILIFSVKCTITYDGTFICEKSSCPKIWKHRTLLKDLAGELYATRIIRCSQCLDSVNGVWVQGLADLSSYRVCHLPQLPFWPSLQDLHPPGEQERISFHTTTHASAQMFSDFAFFGKCSPSITPVLHDL